MLQGGAPSSGISHGGPYPLVDGSQEAWWNLRGVNKPTINVLLSYPQNVLGPEKNWQEQPAELKVKVE